ncbi:DUF4312 family protein [Acerihabitans sp. KWT182]|uniref:DUF4312 family protein n=1 Tax=Acerihabitans sp. KWT182 TaxID=3157919 RepID=A0AAU7QFQ7_9GAMM
MKEQTVIKVRVAGKSDTKKGALSGALSQVQTTVMKTTGNVLLRIEPMQVDVVSAEETLTTEKFLFLFLPRVKRSYSVVLDITVSIIMIDPEKIPFSQR